MQHLRNQVQRVVARHGRINNIQIDIGARLTSASANDFELVERCECVLHVVSVQRECPGEVDINVHLLIPAKTNSSSKKASMYSTDLSPRGSLLKPTAGSMFVSFAPRC